MADLKATLELFAGALFAGADGQSLAGRLDIHRANQVFEKATRRTLSAPRPGTPSSPAHRAAG